MFDLPEQFDPKRTLLFLGSGFSRECKNIIGRDIPSVNKIREDFFKKLDRPLDKYTTLPTLASALSRRDFNFFEYLSKNFTANSAPEYAKQIARLPWMRIYTTNYDDVFEFCAYDTIKPQNYSFRNKMPRRLNPSAIIHLHGYVRELDENLKPHDQLVLDESSYTKAPFKDTPWWKQLERDIANSYNLFFVGYSLKDIEIKRILLTDENSKEKVHFIVGSDMSDFDIEELADYGTVHTIGTNDFSDYVIEAASESEKNLDLKSLRSFRLVELDKDRKSYSPATAPEIYDLIVHGRANKYRLLDPVASVGYVSTRKQGIRSALKALEKHNSLIITSWLGNGKSIFSTLLSAELSRAQYTVFDFNPLYDVENSEISRISQEKNPVIIFDGEIDEASVRYIQIEHPNIKIVLSIRTGLFETRYGYYIDLLGQNSAHIDINLLSDEERGELSEVSRRAAIDLPPVSQSRYVRDLIISAVENGKIAAQIEAIFNSEMSKSKTSSDFILLCILDRLYNVSTSPYIIRDILGEDPFKLFKNFNSDLSEFFSSSRGRIEIFSSVVSKHILNKLVSPQTLIESVVTLIEAKVASDTSGKIPADAGTMMRYQRIRDMLSAHPDANQYIRQMYETLRANDRINYHPLYWLQYSFVFEDEEIDIAERFIEHAYQESKLLEKFDTYQLDTQALRIYMRSEMISHGPNVTRFNDILELINKVSLLLKESKHIQFVIKVFSLIPDFVEVVLGKLTIEERSTLRTSLYEASHLLGLIDDTFRARFGVQSTLDNINTSIRLLGQHHN